VTLMSIGVIGGSGLYDLEGLQEVESRTLETPFGQPSDAYVRGKLGGHEVYFLPRHGRGHRLLPSEINHRANIFGFKALGVERIVSVSAVGSLKEDIHPRDIVLPDQYFDRTKKSAEHTFFGQGIVAHAPFGEPACAALRRHVGEVCRRTVERQSPRPEVGVHAAGTYVNMEGPAFSTKAESFFHRRMGFDVIGMTSLAEAKLCRESEICYQAMAMVTDYDCWHDTEEPVTVEMIVSHLMANTHLAKEILREVITSLPPKRECGCGQAMAGAIFTSAAAMPADRKRALAPLLRKYV
jgi:5'-methylthioadenosine phosphorylase